MNKFGMKEGGTEMTKSKKAQKKLYKKWVRYLKDSRLNEEEIVRRARWYSKKGEEPNE